MVVQNNGNRSEQGLDTSYGEIQHQPGLLHVLNGDREGNIIELDQKLMTAGRHPDNEIYLYERRLSRE